MDRKLVSVILTWVAVLAIFLIAVLGIGFVFKVPSFQTDEATVLLSFVFVFVGALIAFFIYLATRQNLAWEVGTRQVAWMAIGAALFAVFSWLFNGTVFLVPSVSQVSLRPAICIPMFFGYAFGPVVGFFSGAVGNLFGDALTGFGVSPQWSIANGLIGLIAGMPFLFADKKRSLNIVLIIGVVLALATPLLYFLNPGINNLNFYDPSSHNYGADQITFVAGVTILIGLVLVLIVRSAFGNNTVIAPAVTWTMLANILGIGFAAISDIWIKGYTPVTAIVGEFLPAAGSNLIFAAILVPLLLVAYTAVSRQIGQ